MAESTLDKLFSQAMAEAGDEAGKQEISSVQSGADPRQLEPELIEEKEGEVSEAPETSKNIANLIKQLNIPGKIKLALLGNQTARAILIREANRLIPMFVLENPRITENEIHEFARNKDLDDSVVRAIAAEQRWMKNYAVKLAVVSNPKTPLDVSLKWAKYVKEKDMRILSKSRNVPQALATQCRKLLEQRKAH